MNQYTLRIPKDVALQLSRCRVSIRQSIQARLQEIAEAADARRLPRRKASAPAGPPLRFYVLEGFRVSYQVDPVTRSVTVLKLRAASN